MAAAPSTALELTTARLILRPTRLEDFDPWATMMEDEEASRFIGGPQPRAIAWRGFMSVAGAWHLTGCSMFSVLERALDRAGRTLVPGGLARPRDRLGDRA
jgi:RimJ/RimL family protein N-acetyltransferase